MNGTWRKLGLLYCPSISNRHPKLLTHAANPLPLLLEGDVYRIFYSGRDIHNRSSVGAVDIDILKKSIVNDYANPLFTHGPKGSFYSDGVSIGNCYEADGKRYLLFMGWQSEPDRHWRGDIGRLIVRSDFSLELDRIDPFMGSDSDDPVSLSYPWVIKENKFTYSMWYGSTIDWDAGNGEMTHVIKYATSRDGHNWARQGLSVPYKLGIAQAFSRPTVVRDGESDYKMWFSYRSGRGQSYRIGYATSLNGKTWDLDLMGSGIDVSLIGWDSEMIEYPYVFDHKGERYMLYNGNQFGKTGFGLAVMT